MSVIVDIQATTCVTVIVDIQATTCVTVIVDIQATTCDCYSRHSGHYV